MKKREMAEAMLGLLHSGRTDEIAVLCEVTITCRNRVIRDRKHNMSSALYAPEEADAVMERGELVDEVFIFLLKDDPCGIERVLRAYAT